MELKWVPQSHLPGSGHCVRGVPQNKDRLRSALPMQGNDEVPTRETKVTFSLGTSERFWESDHISWDLEQKLLRYPVRYQRPY